MGEYFVKYYKRNGRNFVLFSSAQSQLPSARPNAQVQDHKYSSPLAMVYNPDEATKKHGARRFNLMALPLELRLMVYERMPRRIHHKRLDTQGREHEQRRRNSTLSSVCRIDSREGVVLITRSVPMIVLRLNRKIHREAKMIMNRLARRFILDAGPRIIISGSHYSYEQLRIIMSYLLWGLEHFTVSTALIPSNAVLTMKYRPRMTLREFSLHFQRSTARRAAFDFPDQFVYQAVRSFVYKGVTVGDLPLVTFHDLLPNPFPYTKVRPPFPVLGSWVHVFSGERRTRTDLLRLISLCTRRNRVNLVDMGYLVIADRDYTRATANMAQKRREMESGALGPPLDDDTDLPTMDKGTWIREWIPT
ncbi:hypothetical protein FB567DRAFT_332627 [Paraphoma chrysanthemicola]|uniref:F-box domain-containing protein n=1 Tax=Paraphoma chrysanthemicola TaxID=798071 RepID=A0A8K0R7E1_9PLEO|nr:hypothetical protein FB567DRAFT_332627 [Paraphoma chrysanthemicola]